MANVTLKGQPVQLASEGVATGQPAPTFCLQLSDMSDYTLETDAGKHRILCAIPSLDTPVCDVEMKRFNQEAANLGDAVVVAVSMDLPMAQSRWCGANEAGSIRAASDHRDATFGQAYGCLIRGGPLDRFLCRAIFVIGPDDTIKHVEYVSEIAEEPDYAAALNAAK